MSEWTPGYEPTQPKPAHENDKHENDTLEIGASAPEPTAVTPTAVTPTAVTPTTAAAADPAPGRRGVRIGTVVFGAVMLVISAVCLLALTTRVHVDGTAIGLALLLGAGAALVAGGAASAMREARGGPGSSR